LFHKGGKVKNDKCPECNAELDLGSAPMEDGGHGMPEPISCTECDWVAGKERVPKNIRDASFYENAQYCGTNGYHRLSPLHKVIATDGARHALEKFECFWLADEIGFAAEEYQKEGFITVYAVIKKEGGAEIYIGDGNYNCLFKKEISITDLRCSLKFFAQPQEDYWVLMLPSEY